MRQAPDALQAPWPTRRDELAGFDPDSLTLEELETFVHLMNKGYSWT